MTFSQARIGIRELFDLFDSFKVPYFRCQLIFVSAYASIDACKNRKFFLSAHCASMTFMVFSEAYLSKIPGVSVLNFVAEQACNLIELRAKKEEDELAFNRMCVVYQVIIDKIEKNSPKVAQKAAIIWDIRLVKAARKLENLPYLIQETLDREQAMELKQQLEKLGAVVRINEERRTSFDKKNRI